MTKTLLRFGLAGLMALVAFQGTVSAQAVPPAEPAPVAPAAEPAPAPAPEPVAEPVAAPAPEEAPAEDAAPSIAGWFRMDIDAGGFQPWAGATFPVGELSIATDIYIWSTFGEFDIGPTFTVGSAVLTPMLGFQTDFATQKAASIVPQFYVTMDTGTIYFEEWTQLYLNSIFNSGFTNQLILRFILLYDVSSVVALGAEIDPTINISDAPVNSKGDDITLANMTIGPHVKLGYGTGSYLQLFLGFDASAEGADKPGKLGGRFSFVHNW
jgi:hypothetical protein